MSSFIYRGPVPPDSSLFKGRKNEIERLKNICIGNQESYAIVFGGRQNGKTSLLMRLAYELNQFMPNVHYQRIDFQGIPNATSSQAYKFITHIIKVTYNDMQSSMDIQSADSLAAFLVQTLKHIMPNRLVLMLEELGSLPPSSRQELADAVRYLFTSRIDRYPLLQRLRVILSGSDELYEFGATEGSPLRNVCEPIFLTDLEEFECHELIAEVIGTSIPSSQLKEVERCIFSLTKGHPYITQRMGAYYIETDIQHSENPSIAITEISEKLLKEDRLFSHLIDALKKRNLLSTCERIMNEQVRFSRVDPELARLEILGLIKDCDNRWGFRNPLFERIIQEYCKTGPFEETQRDSTNKKINKISSSAMPPINEKGLRIVWLSDLHIAGSSDRVPFSLLRFLSFHRWLETSFFQLKGNILTHNFPLNNLERALKKVCDLKPQHILITGDLTNFAAEKQFRDIENALRCAQVRIKPESEGRDLDPTLWTILPGNHDVTTKSPVKGRIRRNLGMFLKHFGHLCTPSGSDYDATFPVIRKIESPTGWKIRIIGLDSNTSSPVWVVGLNARGRIDQAQHNSLNTLLTTTDDNSMILIALHHHPIMLTEITSDLHNHYMSLQEEDAHKLFQLCANTGVSAILHGHFHTFSCSTHNAPQGTHQMAIIGSPAGTRNIPGVLEFLELCESRDSSRKGLAVVKHSYQQNSWTDEYISFIDEVHQ